MVEPKVVHASVAYLFCIQDINTTLVLVRAFVTDLSESVALVLSQ